MRCFCWQIQQFCRTVFPCHRNNHLRYFANTCKGFLRWHVLLTILLQRPKKREERYFFALNDDTDLCWDVVREIGKVELCGMLHISINTLSLGFFSHFLIYENPSHFVQVLNFIFEEYQKVEIHNDFTHTVRKSRNITGLQFFDMWC